MKLKHLIVDNFLGHNFEIDNIGASINLVYGPNASGKTLFCKALKALLWPETFRGEEALSIYSLWSLKEKDENICREGNKFDILPEVRGEIPNSLFADVYVITIDDLFVATNEKYQDKVRKEAFGGYDLNLIRRNFESKLVINKEKKEMQEAEKEVERILVSFKDLERRERELDKIKGEIEESKRAKDEIVIFQNLLELKKSEQRLKEIELKLASFPIGLGQMEGNEEELIENIENEEKDLSKKLFLLEDEKKSLDQTLSYPIAPFETIIFYQSEVSNLLSKETELQIKKRELIKAESTLNEECRFLSCTTEVFANFKLEDVQSICNLYRELEDILSAERAILFRKSLFITNKDEEVDLTRDIISLEKWLFANKSSFLIFGLLILPFLSKGFFWPCLGILFGALVYLFNPFLIYRVTKRVKKVWNFPEIRKKLSELKIAYSKKICSENDESLLLDLEKQEKVLKGRTVEIRTSLAKFSLKPNLKEKLFLEALDRGRKALLYVLEIRSQINYLEKECETLLHKINEFFLGNGLTEIVSAKEAEGLFKKLFEKEKEKTASLSSKDLLLLKEAQYEKQLSFLKEEREKIFKRCSSGDKNELKQKISHFSVYEKEVGLFNEEKINLNNLKKLGLNENFTLVEIEEKLVQLRVRALDFEKLLQNKIRIEQEVERAKNAKTLLSAQKKLYEAKNNLSGKVKEFCYNETANFWLDHLERNYKSKTEGKLFTLSSDFLSRFTNGRYVLREDFSAYDVLKKENKLLDELSRGTRMQLLLAIRLAFALLNERNEKMPFFFDEILSSSDDIRENEIIDALYEMAKEERQIFYFTCKKSDVAIWKRRAKELDYPISIINLE